MSFRRLADSQLQPSSFSFNEESLQKAKDWIAKYPKGREKSALVPLLMLAQEQEGWVSKPALEYIANFLDIPFIRVLEVVTFYTQFHLSPVGSCAHIQVCGTVPCMLRGSEDLMDVCRSRIHKDPLHLSEDKKFSWEEVECLGACVNAPLVMIAKDTYEDLTPDRLHEMIDLFSSGHGSSVKTGPQVERFFSAPQSGLTSLKEDLSLMRIQKKMKE